MKLQGEENFPDPLTCNVAVAVFVPPMPSEMTYVNETVAVSLGLERQSQFQDRK